MIEQRGTPEELIVSFGIKHPGTLRSLPGFYCAAPLRIARPVESTGAGSQLIPWQ